MGSLLVWLTLTYFFFGMLSLHAIYLWSFTLCVFTRAREKSVYSPYVCEWSLGVVWWPKRMRTKTLNISACGKNYANIRKALIYIYNIKYSHQAYLKYYYIVLGAQPSYTFVYRRHCYTYTQRRVYVTHSNDVDIWRWVIFGLLRDVCIKFTIIL